MDRSEPRQHAAVFTLNDVRPAALRVLRESLRPLRRRLRRQQFEEVSDVHDARVEIRRARAALSLRLILFNAQRAKRLDRRLAEMGRLLGPVRDLDVVMERSLRWGLERRGEAHVEFLYRLVRVRDELAGMTKRKISRRIEESVMRAGARLLRGEPVSGAAWKCSLEADVRGTLRLLAEPLPQIEFRTGAAVDAASGLERWHEKRKSCRRLRYELESLNSIADFAAAIEFLRGAQARFGAVQDSVVIQERLRGDLGNLMSRRLRLDVLDWEHHALREAIAAANGWWFGPAGWEQTATMIAASLGSPENPGDSNSA